MSATRTQVLGIRRIVAGTLVLVCVGINVWGFVYVSHEHKLIEETMSTMTTEHGQGYAQLCADALVANDPVRLQGVVDAIASGRDAQHALVSDPDGLIIAATDRYTIRNSLSQKHRELLRSEATAHEAHPVPGGFFHESGHNFEFCFPIERDGQHLGTLFVGMNTAWGNEQVKALAMGGLFVLFLVTLVMGLAAVALDWRLRGAVRQLIAVTQAIARGQLAERVRVGTGDELELLGDSVNRMAAALRNSEERIGHWHTRLEQTIAQRTQELEQSQALLAQREKIAALGLMAAGVAHEVGNPLAAMFAILQRIERKAPPELGDKCKIMREQIERISRIVDEMKQFARPASHNDKKLVNVNEVLRLSVQVCRYDPRAKNIRVVADLDPNVPAVSGNADRWQQVFLNLIVNAFDAMSNDGCLTIASKAVGDHVELLFRDTGKGMSPTQLRNLFHPFYSTKRPGHGAGLGLAVCAGIVRSCGGHISVKSKVGHGTEFRVIIPRHEPSKRQAAARPGNSGLPAHTTSPADSKRSLPTSIGSDSDVTSHSHR